MRFRTKVLLLFLGLSVIGNALPAWIHHTQTRAQMYAQIESTALTIASSAAPAFDGDRLMAIHRMVDASASGHEEIVRDLTKLRDDHRSRGLHVRRIFALVKDRTNPRLIRYAIDTDHTELDASALGVYERPPGFEDAAMVPYLLPATMDEEVVTALSPIQSRLGVTVGYLGVDVGAGALALVQQRLITSVVAALMISLILSILFSSILVSWISRPLGLVRKAIGDIGQGRFSGAIDLRSNDEFDEVADALDGMRIGLMQRENLKGALARYVSAEVTESILSDGNSPVLRSERRKITVLFADVRGFTSLSERISPEQVVGMLNEFLEQMVEAVMKNNGYLNKFMGDGLMAVFGATRDDPSQEVHAVQCALDMLQAMKMLRERWKHEEGRAHAHDLQIGIGVNTGDAVVGNIGSEQRMDYTAIGDTVNLASRLEATTKEYPGTHLLVSEATYKSARAAFDFVSVGKLQVRGKRRSVGAYTIPLYQQARVSIDEEGTPEAAVVSIDSRDEGPSREA